MGIFSEDERMRLYDELGKFMRGGHKMMRETIAEHEAPVATTYDDILTMMKAVDDATKRMELEMRTPLQFYCRPEDEDRTREMVELARSKVYAETNYTRHVRPVKVIVTGVPNAIPEGQILMIDPINWST